MVPPEVYTRYLQLRREKPVKIGPLWVESTGHYLADVGCIDRTWVSDKELTDLIDKLWNESQMNLPFVIITRRRA